MTSPLEFVQNARVLVTRAGSRGDASTGYAVTPGQEILVRAYLKQLSPGKLNSYAEKLSLSVSTDVYEGYITSWAEVPSGEDWMGWDPTGAATYNQTGTRPVELRRGEAINFYWSGKESEAAEVIENGSVFGDEGVGAILREKLGDRLILKCEWSA